VKLFQVVAGGRHVEHKQRSLGGPRMTSAEYVCFCFSHQPPNGSLCCRMTQVRLMAVCATLVIDAWADRQNFSRRSSICVIGRDKTASVSQGPSYFFPGFDLCWPLTRTNFEIVERAS
jgi:hypothetical protein